MDVKEWPIGDQKWATQYRLGMKGRSVPDSSLLQRERELLDAIHESGEPAAELFGNARNLASEDADELATTDEMVRTSVEGGLKSSIQVMAGTWLGIGVAAVLFMAIRKGWLVDIDVAHVLIGACVAAVFLGWRVVYALFAAGRAGPAAGALIAVGLVIGTGIASAKNLGTGHIVASEVPILLLALVMLGPGIAVLVVLSRISQQELRENWDDREWFRRFRGSLRARLVPSATARDHVTEVEQALVWAKTTAHAEFGHPLSFARELAAVDRVARARQWWVATTTTTGGPLLIAVLILTNQSWGMLTVPVAIGVVLFAIPALSAAWNDRPRRLSR